MSEQHPLDLISFQYCLPLTLEILDVVHRTEKERTDAEEQITLVLEFISFQATLCIFFSYSPLTLGENQDLPRVRLIQRLLDVLLLAPAVLKLARDTFLQVTDAISTSESKDELNVLMHGLLKPSSNVRNAILQTLESFDLEESGTPEILFLALHDSDERNCELAKSLYDANSLTLDPSGLSRLFCFLGQFSSLHF